MSGSPLVGALVFSLVVQSGPGPSASVVGVVRDAETGRPVSEAVVRLTDLGRWSVTDDEGRYVMAGLPPGPQHLSVGAMGYESRVVHLLAPRTGRLELNVALRPRPIELRRIIVSPTRPIRGRDPEDTTAFPDRGISRRALLGHPSLAEPDVFRALAGGEVVMDPESPTGVHVRGGAADQTAYRIDELPVLSPYHAGGLFSSFNPDAFARIQLDAAAPSPGLPHALSGVVTAVTLPPGQRVEARGSLSTTQARVTADGPLGWQDAGYLVGWRSGFPGSIVPDPESSYVKGESGDVVAKVEGPVLGGRLRLLAYGAADELGVAAGSASSGDPAAVRLEHSFEWDSRSAGAFWSRSWSGLTLRAGAWRAAADAGATWRTDLDPTRMEARREDRGAHVSMTRRGGGSATEVGLRVREIRTRYAVGPPGVIPEEGPPSAKRSLVVGTAHAEQVVDLGGTLRLRGGLGVTKAGSAFRLEPRAEVRWRATEGTTWVLAGSRSHQFAQSLRNAESVVGHVFPVDLSFAAGPGGVPVARSDQLVAAGTWTPTPGLRLGGQAYVRSLRNVVLVAAGEVEPFAEGPVPVGTGSVRGASLDFAATWARFGVVASYGWQRTRYFHEGRAFAPGHASAHQAEAGVSFFPSPTTVLRLDLRAVGGRVA
ncbi:MAG: carboxypeptidase regulatory-like domain-containing protein, partial [Gemmatimonadota bacterium]